ncbi:MAG: type II secretion system F family protein [Candidatus Omnitrophica bacterium]|nr:type II secretion system F family protein [Candidatus Omnitrophota bacterium]
MAQFNYEARDKSGNKVKGRQEASNKDDLVAMLQAKGYVVSSIAEEAQGAPSAGAGLSKIPARSKGRKHSRINSADLVLFARQLATLLNAGVSILKSLEIITRQTESRGLEAVVARVISDMEGGLSLHESLGKHKRVFSELWVNLIETGEASGNLGAVLERLAGYLEQKASLKSKIISAMIYPAILFVTACGAIAIFMLKIIPTFAEIFSGFNMELPALTKMLMDMTELMKKGLFPAAIVAFALLFILRQYINTPVGRRKFDIFMLRVPIVGNVVKIIALERFASTMSTLVQSGVPILYSLEITERSIGNKVLEETLRVVKESVRGGKSLSGPLEASGLFPPMVVQMVAVGEEIGELPQMFKRISDYYAEVIETLITRLTAAFEPIMLIFMAFIIGTMVVAMFLPIFQITKIAG